MSELSELVAGAPSALPSTTVVDESGHVAPSPAGGELAPNVSPPLPTRYPHPDSLPVIPTDAEVLDELYGDVAQHAEQLLELVRLVTAWSTPREYPWEYRGPWSGPSRPDSENTGHRVDLPAVNAGELVEVERVSVTRTDAGALAPVRLYRSDVGSARFIAVFDPDSTATGFAFQSFSPPVRLGPGEHLVVYEPGSVPIVATAQYRMARVPSLSARPAPDTRERMP